MGLRGVHLQTLPLTRLIVEVDAPEDELIIEPVAHVQKVNHVKLLLRTEAARAVTCERLNLLNMLHVGVQVPVLIDTLGPHASRVTLLISDEKLHDVFRNVLWRIGVANVQTIGLVNSLDHQRAGLVAFIALAKNGLRVVVRNGLGLLVG